MDAIADRDDASGAPDELLAAGAVVLRPLLEDRVGPFGEGRQILLVQIVAVQINDEDVRLIDELLERRRHHLGEHRKLVYAHG
jgi:hypothetical protein